MHRETGSASRFVFVLSERAGVGVQRVGERFKSSPFTLCKKKLFKNFCIKTILLERRGWLDRRSLQLSCWVGWYTT